MKAFKVEQLILCEVRTWGYVEANSMHEAMVKVAEMGTGDGHDHEIISDVKTLSVEIEEDSK